ncbi:MAG TPA: ferritin-like domain-containing protein [Solirubrobacteraceae bacterium]|nr:ferritin-like domain-containing protein [Solirubrobacteraceae bacterium]
MTDPATGVSRSQFIRNAAKGSVALVGAGGVLATMDGVAFAKTTSTDITVLQTGYIAETLAVEVYTAIVTSLAHKFKLGNLDYFRAALENEKAHQAAWKKALGPKHTPRGFMLNVPHKYIASKHALLETGVTLEEAFVATYMGAVREFNSEDLKVTAAGVAADEATHFSFLDAALGGHGVLPPFGPNAITAGTAAKTLTKLGFLTESHTPVKRGTGHFTG